MPKLPSTDMGGGFMVSVPSLALGKLVSQLNTENLIRRYSNAGKERVRKLHWWKGHPMNGRRQDLLLSTLQVFWKWHLASKSCNHLVPPVLPVALHHTTTTTTKAVISYCALEHLLVMELPRREETLNFIFEALILVRNVHMGKIIMISAYSVIRLKVCKQIITQELWADLHKRQKYTISFL